MFLLKPIKLLLFLVAFLLVAVFVAGYFADDIAKKGIEAGGTHALGVKTEVDSCHVGFFTSTFSLKNLSVANPEGFGEAKFLELGKGSVEVGAATLLSDKIALPALELTGIRLRLIRGLNGSNYGRILDNLDRFQGGASTSESDGKRFVIKKLEIRDVEVMVVPVKELNLPEATIPIDEIVMTDVGSDSDKGVLLSDLAGIVVEAILKRASVSGQLPDLIKGSIDGQLARLRGLADAGIQGLPGLIGGRLPMPAGGLPKPPKLPGEIEKGVGDARKSIEKGLKGLGIGR